MTAANLGSRVTGYGFVRLHWSGSLVLDRVGAADRPAGTDLDQCRPHRPRHLRHLALARPPGHGSRRALAAAAEASEATPGEALFPVSLLTRAPVNARGEGDRPLHRRDGRLPQRPARVMSSFPKAASPASARRCAAAVERRARSRARRVIASLSTRTSSSASRTCRGTNGRRADRHRRARRSATSRGSMRLRRAHYPAERNQRAGASDHVPCLAAIRRSRGSVAPIAARRGSAAARDDRRD